MTYPESMTGHGDPPDGTPDGAPEGFPGGDDEYRSIVFDESFVRAARLQEFSAQERMRERGHAVRSLPSRVVRSGPRQIFTLLVLISLAFGTAIYLGVRHPYRATGSGNRAISQLRMTVVPLAPRRTVPGGTPADLLAHSPAAQFRPGASGITLPDVRRTTHYSASQVVAALTTAKDYLVASSLDPEVLTGQSVRPVRLLLDPDQTAQFDRSVASPANDGLHAALGWLVRFDAAKVVPTAAAIRVQGTLQYAETADQRLQVTSNHTFVYALRPVAAASAALPDASLFTVRRELHFGFDSEDLQKHRTELQLSEVQAGPQSCSAAGPGRMTPLLAGDPAPTAPAVGTDPYATGAMNASLCGVLAPAAEPSPAAS